MKTLRWIAVVLLVPHLAWAMESAPQETPAERTRLGFDELMSPAMADKKPLQNAHFVAQGQSGAAKHELSGKIVLQPMAMNTIPAKIMPEILYGKTSQNFPGFDVEFISHEGHLIPADRTFQASKGDSSWLISIAPDRV